MKNCVSAERGMNASHNNLIVFTCLLTLFLAGGSSAEGLAALFWLPVELAADGAGERGCWLSSPAESCCSSLSEAALDAVGEARRATLGALLLPASDVEARFNAAELGCCSAESGVVSALRSGTWKFSDATPANYTKK
jgi:hypothetical protein